MGNTTAQIPTREQVPREHQWNLNTLYGSDQAWEADFELFRGRIPRIAEFSGTLGQSAAALRDCLEFMTELGIQEERLGYYAHLRTTEDAGDSERQRRWSRFLQAATEADAAASYQNPEIQAIPDETMEQFLADPLLADYRISLRKIRRFKPHVLSAREEKLLAMQQEANQTARRSFGALTDVDMNFGTIATPEGRRTITQSTFSSLMLHPNRDVRRRAWKQFMAGYDGHKNTLASLYAGSVQLDIYSARVRNYRSARAAALFADDVAESVYDNLIATVRESLPALHQYYDLRRRLLQLDELHLWDTRVPLVADLSVIHSYEQAVDMVIESLAPLGDEYTGVLRRGLLGGWVDRYENKGKRSGAFSAGSYVGEPYILLNYKQDVLRDVFTIAHEAGHSMHSWYSTQANPFQHYQYTIFEAEVASTFNEQLLFEHMMAHTSDRRMQAYLVNKQVDDIIATLFRQTMFAEFEHRAHAMVESGEPLTVDSIRSTYRSLLTDFFGPEVVLDKTADLESLRIPHFYRAFYVYKYATGISAALSLAQRVTGGGTAERDAYFAFLKSGGSRFPIDSLRAAGVDMSDPQPIREALAQFERLVQQMERLLAGTSVGS
ncbi:MAG: oligoendopeptidase F [Spirochaetaceae bacterium]|nr:MAG: oligoendopeptidase F [Spirochaetaceae bacterium]